MSKELHIESASTLWLESVLASHISSYAKIDRGGNNRIFKLLTDTNEAFVYKEYFIDDRNRMNREYNALEFLGGQNLSCIPHPIAKNIDQNCALYTFVEGDSENADDPKTKDKFDQSVMTTDSFTSFVDIISFRLNKFLKHIKSTEAPNILTEFYNRVSPHKIINSRIANLKRQNTRLFHQQIQSVDKRLSSVDFGPHNMIFGKDQVNFIDFEYFGWDDPVKIVPNLIFHEGSASISKSTKDEILHKYISSTKLQAQVVDRLSVSLSLASLDWLSILLWGLTPEKISARQFSDPNLNVVEYQENQIAKIMKRLETLDNPQLL